MRSETNSQRRLQKDIKKYYSERPTLEIERNHKQNQINPQIIAERKKNCYLLQRAEDLDEKRKRLNKLFQIAITKTKEKERFNKELHLRNRNSPEERSQTRKISEIPKEGIKSFTYRTDDDFKKMNLLQVYEKVLKLE